MRKWIPTILLLLLLVIAAAPVQAMAEVTAGKVTTTKGNTAEIPFTVQGLPSTVVIAALTPEDAPLPPLADRSVTIPQEGDAPVNYSGKFVITYDTPGDYFYTITQVERDDNHDDRVYEVLVRVMYDDDNDLQCSVVSYEHVPENPGTEETNPSLKLDVAFHNPPPTTLTVTKTAWRNGEQVKEVFAGDTVTYQIEVQNVGRGPAYNVVVTDTLPTQTPKLELNIESISDDGVLNSDKTAIIWELGTLRRGATKTVSFTVKVPEVSTGTTWKNIVTAIHDDPATPGIPSSEVEIFAAVPHAVIDKDQARNDGTRTKDLLYVVPGDTLTYYVTFTNDSNATVLDVTITDEVPAGLQLARVEDGGAESGGVITWQVGDLEPGESATVRFVTTVPQVTVRTVWTNEAAGTYMDGTKAPTTTLSALWRALAGGAGTVTLQTNQVQAIYEPPTTPEPDAPGTPGTPGGAPQTGDTNNIGLWFALMVGSLLVLAGFYLAGKTRRQDP